MGRRSKEPADPGGSHTKPLTCSYHIKGVRERQREGLSRAQGADRAGLSWLASFLAEMDLWYHWNGSLQGWVPFPILKLLLLSLQKTGRPFSETQKYWPRYLRPLKDEQKKVSALFWGSTCACKTFSQLIFRNGILFGLEILKMW